MNRVKIGVLFVLAFLWVTCAEKEAVYPVVVETIEGVTVVSNPDYPRDGKRD